MLIKSEDWEITFLFAAGDDAEILEYGEIVIIVTKSHFTRAYRTLLPAEAVFTLKNSFNKLDFAK